nr:DUF4976 domain-containing protein [Pseudomonadales bacterium]
SRGRSLLPLLEPTRSGQGVTWENVAFSEFCTDDSRQHRMIRQGEWKLNYYHGQPVQLFNLAEDPDELNDLAGHPDYTGVQQELIDRVLDGWDPDRIAETIRHKRVDYDIIADWARNTKPVDQYRWQLLPEMDYLNK